MNRGLVVLLLFVLTVLSFTKLSATHIVGGELSYTDLGNNRYQVTLKLYKDCGISIVPFDNPAEVYVYGSDSIVMDTLELPLIESDTLAPTFDDTCLIVPSENCVDFALYQAEFTFPSNEGYTLAYIRCCRNATIINAQSFDEFGNIIPPDFMGATYYATIPPNITNSNPVFKELPPIILCAGQEIDVDQSAFDADGDQLVYSICTPNIGGSIQQVFGNPLEEMPPFELVDWIEPYDENDVLGGDLPLTIDPVTGRMTGIAPNRIAQFVVAVCVQEFRNGQLLSESKRDFQFNIADCAPVYSSDYEIDAEPYIDTIEVVEQDTNYQYLLLCDSNLLVQFESLIEDSTKVLWDFGDGSSDTTYNPTHVFEDTGFYEVSLIAQPGDICADTFLQIVSVQYLEIEAAFNFEQPLCYNALTGLQFTDATQDANQLSSWLWDFGDGNTSTEQHPIHLFQQDGIYTVSLYVEANNGCASLLDTTIEIQTLPPYELIDVIALCGEDSIVLPLEIEGTHDFIWQPSSFIEDNAIQQPIVFPNTNTIFQVEILTDRNDAVTCSQIGSIFVLTEFPLPTLVNQSDSIQCDSMVAIQTDLNDVLSVQWSLDNSFSNIISNSANFDFIQQADAAFYYAQLENEFCSSTDSVEVIQHAIYVEPIDTSICDFESILLQPVIQSNDSEFSATWSLEDEVLATNVLEIDVTPIMSSSYSLVLSNEGCVDSSAHEVALFDLPLIELLASDTFIINELEVEFSTIDELGYEFTWLPETLFQDINTSNPTAVIDESVWIELLVTDENNCVELDSIFIRVQDIPCEEPDIFIPNAFSPNNDGLNDVFRVQGVVIKQFYIEIYDRWGNRVFEANDLNSSWDGFNEQGVFGYNIEIECFGGNKFVKSGSITVVK